MNELSSLGLKPAILHELIEASEGIVPSATTSHIEDAGLEESLSEPSEASPAPPCTVSAHPSPPESIDDTHTPRVVYELDTVSGKIEPKLRIWINMPAPEVEFPKDVGVHLSRALELLQLDEDVELVADGEVEGHGGGRESLLWSLQQKGFEGTQVDDRTE